MSSAGSTKGSLEFILKFKIFFIVLNITQKVKTQMESKYTIRGLILDICSMKSHVSKLIDEEKEYSKIIKYLIKLDYYDDDNFLIPTAKVIEKETGVKYSKIRKHLEEIYSKLSADYSETEVVFEFTEVEIIFYLKGYKGRTAFICKNLSILPQIDEMVNIPFFNELTGTTMFYVKGIDHNFVDTKQQIFICMEMGMPNSYIKIRKDMAYETGELNYFNTRGKSEYEITKMLDIRIGKVW